ncbi:MAG: carboxyl transferase domain-containing protein [Eubacterium sp.]
MGNSVKTTEALKRLSALFDDGIFTEIDAYAKDSNGDIEVVAGYGCVNGSPAYAFSQDVSVNNGAIGIAQCAKILKVYDLAAKTGCPVIGIYDSNGVKLNEGFEALSAYGDIVKAATSVSGVVPQISVVAGACLGTSALMANMADIVIGVKDADFYISAPSEVTAEDNYSAGAIDILVDSFDEAADKVKSIVGLLPSNNLSPAPIFDFSNPASVCSVGLNVSDVIEAIADAGSVVEIKSGYATSVVTAFATVAGSTVGFVAFKGDALCHGCAYKAEAMIKLCDAYNIPIITIANANGVNNKANELSLIAVTKLTSAYSTATCPKISLITDQSIGSAYIVLAGKGANADLTFAWDNAVVSPLEVSSAVAFLYNDRLAQGEDRAQLESEYKETVGSPFTAAACGAIDDVFAPEETRAKLIAAIDMLAGKREVTIARKHSVK